MRKSPVRNNSSGTSFWLFLTIAGGFLALTSSCKQQRTGSSQKSLESNDWFRSGKDRFYLAQLRLAGTVEGTKMPRGSELVVGLGCAGENNNWKAPDPKKPGRGLHQRQYYNPVDPTLSDFPLGDPEHLKNNECAVLLGSQQGAIDFINKANESAASPLTQVGGIINYGMTAWSLWTCANDLGLIAAVVGSGGALAPAALAESAAVHGAFSVAKIAKEGASRGAYVVKKTVNATATKGVSGLAVSNVIMNVGLTAAGLQDPLTALLFAGTTLLGGFSTCGDAALFLGLNVQQKKDQNNRILFMDHFAGALEYGQITLLQKFPDYANLAKSAPSGSGDSATDSSLKSKLSPSDQVRMMAELNSVAVPYFNSDDRAYGQFEQGWFGAQDFFKTVKDINKEMSAAQKQAQALAQQKPPKDL